MKSIILYFFLLLLSTNASIGQTSDSVLTPEQAIVYMSSQMTKSHNEFKSGTGLLFAGIGVTALSFLIPADNSVETAAGVTTTETNSIQTFVLATGVVITFVGTIMHINSHRHIGKAGRVRLKGNSIVLDLDK